MIYNDVMQTFTRVTRPKQLARQFYDRISGIYDALASSEAPFCRRGLALLAPQAGERVLEIGFGTGCALVEIAAAVGHGGQALGLDLSPGMARAARGRLARAGVSAVLCVGDAAALPYAAGGFDAVFLSFTLDLIDTPESPLVFAACARVLRAGGRLGVVALLRQGRAGGAERAYAWFHTHLPGIVDCRPIPLHALLQDSGWRVAKAERASMWGLPVVMAVGIKPTP